VAVPSRGPSGGDGALRRRRQGQPLRRRRQGQQGRPPGLALSERLTGVAYQLGWKVICRVPEGWARWAFAAVAGIAWRRQGPGVQVLEANLRRVLSWKHGTDEVDGKELRALSRAALQSYARYWLEVFRLPVIPVERLVTGMHINPEGEAAATRVGLRELRPAQGIPGLRGPSADRGYEPVRDRCRQAPGRRPGLHRQ